MKIKMSFIWNIFNGPRLFRILRNAEKAVNHHEHEGIILFVGPRSNYLFGPLIRLFSVFLELLFFRSDTSIFDTSA